MKTNIVLLVLVESALLAYSPAMIAQGLLVPPGSPAPTMKSLDQIDAHIDTAASSKRTPIDSVNTPGDATSTYIIAQTGSYYLTGNVSGVSGKCGITINADNVTVDLNGFAMIGVTGSNDGILSSKDYVCIRNGSLRSWGGNGVNLTGNNSFLEDIRSSKNAKNGLNTSQIAVIKDCVTSNNGQFGILLVDGTVSGCVATSNTSSGIFAQGAATIKDCLAKLNLEGFRASNGCIFTGCLGSGNTGDGFYFTRNCLLTGNSAVGNGSHGFEVVSNGGLNRLDGNTAIENSGYGIFWANDLVIRNNCYSNSLGNYNPPSGPAMGPLGAARDSTYPFANF